MVQTPVPVEESNRPASSSPRPRRWPPLAVDARRHHHRPHGYVTLGTDHRAAALHIEGPTTPNGCGLAKLEVDFGPGEALRGENRSMIAEVAEESTQRSRWSGPIELFLQLGTDGSEPPCWCCLNRWSLVHPCSRTSWATYQLTSSMRRAAGLAGFLILSQSCSGPPIGLVAALADDALQPHAAGVLEHHRAQLAVHVLGQHDAVGRAPAASPASPCAPRAAAISDRRRRGPADRSHRRTRRRRTRRDMSRSKLGTPSSRQKTASASMTNIRGLSRLACSMMRGKRRDQS